MSKEIATCPCALGACTVRSSVPRRLRLLSSTAALTSALLLAPVAVGNECGPVIGDQVTCTSGGNFYTTGITYGSSDVSGDLTMTVQDGVEVAASGNDVEGIFIDVTTPSPTPACCGLPPSPALSTGTTPMPSFIPPMRAL